LTSAACSVPHGCRALIRDLARARGVHDTRIDDARATSGIIVAPVGLVPRRAALPRCSMVLTECLDRLTAFEPVPFPVLSLYLDMRPDATGRDQYDAFLRKAFRERMQTWPPHSPERESFAHDADRITSWLEREVRPSANGLALFACAGADLFESVQLDVPIEGHHLYVGDRPHLYPLARLDDQYPRYAAVVLDTNLARMFVFGTGQPLRTEEIQSPRTKQVKVGDRKSVV